MEELKVFENAEFGQIRTLEIDGEPWFVGKDVAIILGYGNPSKAVSAHIDDEDKRFLMIDIAHSQNGKVPIGQSKTAVINESGLFSLILSSKLPSAKKFKRWVTSEVLPSIRKTGSYKTPNRKAADKKAALASVNNTAKIVAPYLEKAGVDPVQITYFLKDIYEPAGVNIPMVRKEQEKLYEQTEIAEILGVYSNSGRPHAQAVGAIIAKLDIDDGDIVKTSFSRNGHTDISNQYREPVMGQVADWLTLHEYPEVISHQGKNYTVYYKEFVAI